MPSVASTPASPASEPLHEFALPHPKSSEIVLANLPGIPQRRIVYAKAILFAPRSAQYERARKKTNVLSVTWHEAEAGAAYCGVCHPGYEGAKVGAHPS